MTDAGIADSKAAHYSSDKSGVDQIPPELLLEWGEVFTYGANKYARDNWLKGTDWHEFYGSALRHLFRFWQGENIDPESGLPHLAHAIWNCGAVEYFRLKGLGIDSRKAAPAPQNLAQGNTQLEDWLVNAPDEVAEIILGAPETTESLRCDEPCIDCDEVEERSERLRALGRVGRGRPGRSY